MLVFFLITVSYSLSCPSLYDYSLGYVRCVNACEPNTIQLGNNCCSKNQYLMNNRCYLCSGWVVNNGQKCCNYNQYWNEQLGECQKCETEIFLNGTLCCRGCTYVDMTSSPPACRPIGQGSCSNLTCTSKQRICCPGGQILNAFQNKCVINNSITVDSNLQVGCPSNYYLDYVYQSLSCVARCSSGVRIDSILCSSKYCTSSSTQSLVLRHSQIFQPILALENSRCCYAINNGMCVLNNTSCIKRYEYNLHPICCSEGHSFNMRSNNCSLVCQDTIIMGLFCLPANTFIDFTTTPPITSSHNLGLCNGKPLPTKMNICCPSGYYSNGLKGCQPCRANIFGTTNYQVCCSKNQYFSEQTKQCLNCDGVIDSSGRVCCASGSYISYNNNGTVSCIQQCALQSIQNTIYCCLFCQSSCQSPSQSSCSTPNYCSSSYFIPNSCNPCSCGSCTTNTNCVPCGSNSVTLGSCSEICQNNKILEGGVCLDCHQSCKQCTAALDDTKCKSCSEGFYNNAGTCEKCHYKCKTCQVSATRCTGCYNSSTFSKFLNNSCMIECKEGTYLNIDTCSVCNSQCRTCSSFSVCITCYSSYYLSNSNCLPCSSSCLQCSGSSTSCTYCRSPLTLTSSSSTCSSDCSPSNIKVLINSQLGYICKSCDPGCITCLPTPIDCIQCKIGFYMNTTLGTSSCFPCQKGCQTCTASSECAGRCGGGYFKDSLNRCIQCDVSCLSCNGSLPNNCLSCGPNITLTNNRCVGCAPTCLTCTSPYVCTSCVDPYVFYGANSSCLLNCPALTFRLDQNCISCIENCLQCVSINSCTRCNGDYPFVDDGKCVRVCGRGKYIVGSQCRLCNGTVYLQARSCCLLPLKIINNICVDQRNNNTVEPIPISPNNTLRQKQVQQLVRISKDKLYLTLIPINPNITSVQLLYPLPNSSSYLLSSSSLQLQLYLQTANSITYVSNILNITPEGYLVRSPNSNNTLLQYSSHLMTQSYYSYIKSSSIKYLNVLSIILYVILFVFGLLSKFKGHYIAEQANLLVIHCLNFCQTAALFKYIFVLPKQLFSFLEGLMVSHFSFFWNMFSSLIPKQYLQPNYPGSLNPDGNFFRLAGFSISFIVITTAVFVACVVVSYILFCCSSYQQPPFIRKILRFYFFLTSLCFMNITFCAVVSVRYHHVSSQETMNPSLYSRSFGVGIFFLILIPILIMLQLLHYYLTYVQQLDEYLYTLREGAQLFYTYFQAIILGLSVSKYTTLFLIIMELLWLAFNICLDLNRDSGFKIRLSVISGLIALSYLFLSLGKQINIGVIVILCLVIITLIVYCSYHVVGLYYYCLCGNQQQQEQEQEQHNQSKD